MTSHLVKRTSDRDSAVGNRCPAGTQVQSEASVPKLDNLIDSKSEMNSSLSSDASQSAVTGDTHHGHLVDLAYAAEQARIEGRKNHKRITDAIYARRRRLREKEQEEELVRQAEQAHQVNKKLRQENKELQSMLSGAVAEVEEMGDTEKNWLHSALEKLKATSTSTKKVTEESNDASKSSSLKRQSKNIKSTSKPTGLSNETGSHLRSLNGKTDIESVQVEDTTARSDSSGPLHVMNGSDRIVPMERNNHPDSNDIPQPTDVDAIEALRQESYLQGLQDAVLLNRRRNVLVANHNRLHQRQPQPPLIVANTTNHDDILQSTLLNDPINQRTIDQLLLARRINELRRCADSSVISSELRSILDRRNLLRGGGYNPTADPLLQHASMLGYTLDPAKIATLARLRANSAPSVSPSLLRSPLTSAQILALTSTNLYPLQSQLLLLNSNNDRTSSLASLYQHHQPQEQQVSLLEQLHQQERESPPNRRSRFYDGARRI